MEQNQREQQKGQTFFVIITVNENKQGIDTHRQKNDDAPVSMAILKLYNQEYSNQIFSMYLNQTCSYANVCTRINSWKGDVES